MPGQDPFVNAISIETVSVIVAAVLVWLSALIQHLSNVSERGSQYVLSDRSVPPPLQGFFGRATRTLANNIESALMWVPPMRNPFYYGRGAQASFATSFFARLLGRSLALI